VKPEAQRIAIAEWCGWVTDAGYENSLRDNAFYGSCPARGIRWQRCPDYLNDLNAIHEAENKLDKGQAMEFERQLRTVCSSRYYSSVISSSAAQRAEALLKTMDLWTDEPTHPTVGGQKP